MLSTKLLSFGAAAMFAASATAQACSDNLYRLHMVDAAGVVVPSEVDPVTGERVYLFNGESVYLAFDAALPSGTYYVHVTDPIGNGDEVLSENDPMDRFVSVTNNAGVISLSLPFTNNPNPAVFGLGLNGAGQSIRLSPFRSRPSEPCRFKAWYGDTWDLSFGPENPYLLLGGVNPTTGLCAVRSYESFRVGSGNGSDVSGVVFLDTDRDGVRDPGEAGAANWGVTLVTGTTSLAAQTNGNGEYRFVDVAAGSYTVELTLQPGYVATTPSSHTIEVCGCADVAVETIGVAHEAHRCDGHTIGFWRNRHGLCLVQHHHILRTLPALCLVDTCGRRVAPGNLCEFAGYLRCANAWNMAYMLSAQLLAMHCNVMVGFVDLDCVIRDRCLGNITIRELMARAAASLCAHPYTPPCSRFRREQEILKNALDNANNNRNWF
jgi:hypothetical protein